MIDTIAALPNQSTRDIIKVHSILKSFKKISNIFSKRKLFEINMKYNFFLEM